MNSTVLPTDVTREILHFFYASGAVGFQSVPCVSSTYRNVRKQWKAPSNLILLGNHLAMWVTGNAMLRELAQLYSANDRIRWLTKSKANGELIIPSRGRLHILSNVPISPQCSDLDIELCVGFSSKALALLALLKAQKTCPKLEDGKKCIESVQFLRGDKTIGREWLPISNIPTSQMDRLMHDAKKVWTSECEVVAFSFSSASARCLIVHLGTESDVCWAFHWLSQLSFSKV
jgi:hypothetical protein